MSADLCWLGDAAHAWRLERPGSRSARTWTLSELQIWVWVSEGVKHVVLWAEFHHQAGHLLILPDCCNVFDVKQTRVLKESQHIPQVWSQLPPNLTGKRLPTCSPDGLGQAEEYSLEYGCSSSGRVGFIVQAWKSYGVQKHSLYPNKSFYVVFAFPTGTLVSKIIDRKEIKYAAQKEITCKERGHIHIRGFPFSYT